MNSTQTSSKSKTPIDVKFNNLPVTKKKSVSAQTHPQNGKSQSNTQLAYQQSGNQNIIFPESAHEKTKINSYEKDVNNKKLMIENERNLEKIKFQKIQSSDSSNQANDYSNRSETESYPRNSDDNFGMRKEVTTDKVQSISRTQTEHRNKDSLEYGKMKGDLKNTGKKRESPNEALIPEDSDRYVPEESEKLIYAEEEKNREDISENFDHILKAIQVIENEIIILEKVSNQSETPNSDLKELIKNRDILIGLAGQYTEIFSRGYRDGIPRSFSEATAGKSKIRRTCTLPRTADAKRRISRAALIKESSRHGIVYPENKPEASDDDAYYKELCSEFSACLKKINKINDDLKKDSSSKKKYDAKYLLKNQYKILGNLAKELQAISSETPEILMPGKDAQESTNLLEKIKSASTRKLEDEYNTAMEEYKKDLENVYSSAWMKSVTGKFFAGPLAFIASFGTANTINRLIPPEHQTWCSYSLSPFLAAAGHGIFTGPIAKQCLSTMWTSPILGEMTNYYRLLGSYWSDSCTNKLNEKKYQGKDAAKAEKLNIKERWAEERSIFNIGTERIKTEETGFSAYISNYVLKSVGPTFYPAVFSPKDMLTRAFDATAHFVAGTVASIQNVYMQQHLRSLDPKAKELILPTREISGMEAAKLRSLATDLAMAIDSDEYKNDQTARHFLVRLLRQTNKAAVIAERKATALGTLKQELLDSFKDIPSRLDMAAEVLGRFISLTFVAGMSQVTAEFRKSSDPLIRTLGFAIPAISLIAPPGWAFRGLYTGYARALLQFCYELCKSDDKPVDMVTRIPKKVQEPMDGATQSEPKSDSGDNDVSNDADNRADDDSSIIVSISDDSDDSDDWDGNPMSRDERGM